MRNFFNALWQDDHGFVISSELVFVATLLVIGITTGLTTIRDQVLGELGDVADAISEVNQSYSISAVTAHAASTNGVVFQDENDFCENDAANDDQSATNLPQCLNIIAAASEQ